MYKLQVAQISFWNLVHDAVLTYRVYDAMIVPTKAREPRQNSRAERENKMKRFIKEFANYQIKGYTENELMRNDVREAEIAKIRQAVRLEEKGLITVSEAMWIISGIMTA